MTKNNEVELKEIVDKRMKQKLKAGLKRLLVCLDTPLWSLSYLIIQT